MGRACLSLKLTNGEWRKIFRGAFGLECPSAGCP
ncbi:unnamed protein product [Amoebophrya sp. A25]|nr:unnamed protein product [Amoebophrya sp. A25]|eukprot:GSA25T00014523001.1